MSGQLRAALLVFATDVANKGLGWALPVGVHHLAVPLQVAEAAEAAAAEVAAVGSVIAVDQRVARQQGLELKRLAADWTGEGPGGRHAPLAPGIERRIVDFDPQVDA